MLSWIASDYFEKSPVLVFPMIALFLFMGAFLIIAVRAFLRRHTDIDRMAQMPLEEDGCSAPAEEDR